MKTIKGYVWLLSRNEQCVFESMKVVFAIVSSRYAMPVKWSNENKIKTVKIELAGYELWCYKIRVVTYIIKIILNNVTVLYS